MVGKASHECCSEERHVCVSVGYFGSSPHLTVEELTTLRGNLGTGNYFSEEQSPASATSRGCDCRRVHLQLYLSLLCSLASLSGTGRDTQHAAASLHCCNPIKYPPLICRK